MFDEDDIYSPPRFDVQICYNDCMPPIYDDYCYDLYAIKNNDIHETYHHDFNFHLDYAHMIVILLSLLPLLFMRRNLLMWGVIKILCL